MCACKLEIDIKYYLEKKMLLSSPANSKCNREKACMLRNRSNVSISITARIPIYRAREILLHLVTQTITMVINATRSAINMALGKNALPPSYANLLFALTQRVNPYSDFSEGIVCRWRHPLHLTVAISQIRRRVPNIDEGGELKSFLSILLGIRRKTRFKRWDQDSRTQETESKSLRVYQEDDGYRLSDHAEVKPFSCMLLLRLMQCMFWARWTTVCKWHRWTVHLPWFNRGWELAWEKLRDRWW